MVSFGYSQFSIYLAKKRFSNLDGSFQLLSPNCGVQRASGIFLYLATKKLIEKEDVILFSFTFSLWCGGNKINYLETPQQQTEIERRGDEPILMLYFQFQSSKLLDHLFLTALRPIERDFQQLTKYKLACSTTWVGNID